LRVYWIYQYPTTHSITMEIVEDKKQERLVYQKEYNEKNKEKIASYQKLYYQRKKEALKNKQRTKIEVQTEEEKRERLARNRMYANRWLSKLSEDELERRKEMQKKYREENKEKFRKYREDKAKVKDALCIDIEDVKSMDPNYFKCDCGKYVSKTNKIRHIQTKAHQKCMLP
jgi:hypothetical protein